MFHHLVRRASVERPVTHALSLMLLIVLLFGLNGCDSPPVANNGNQQVANANTVESPSPLEDLRVADIPVGGVPYSIPAGQDYKITAFNEEAGPYQIVVASTAPLLTFSTSTAKRTNFVTGTTTGAPLPIKVTVPVKPAGAQLKYVAVPFSADGSTKAGAMIVIFDLNATIGKQEGSSENANANTAASPSQAGDANSNAESTGIVPLGSFTTPVGVVIIRSMT